MFKPLAFLLARVVRTGNLVFIDAKGIAHRFGDGGGAVVVVRIADRRLERHLAFDPELAAGEGYMSGRLIVENGSIYDFIALMMRNLADRPFPTFAQRLAFLRRVLRRASQFNPAGRARQNVMHHYDIDARIYDLFLDPDRQYSCAYFATPGMGLADAQAAKKRHIAAKLALEPGQRVLDIGCGWGGLALYLAKAAGVNVTGVTLSSEQIKIARERAVDSKLSNTPEFLLCDYRALTGTFDRIVSVGMFEHVGLPHYATFFQTLAARLAPGGTALIHTIGRTDRPAGTNPFIARYIFPGGYIPALSEIMTAVEGAGLIVSDVEVLRLHYAETLKAWRRRFLANRPAAVAIAGEDFVRMWEFYLAGSEAAFRFQNFVVFQLQLTRRVDALPITRSYMMDAERALPLRTDEEAPHARNVSPRRSSN